MISNTYNKYLWLLNTLLLHKRLSFDEIKRKWETSYLSEGKSLNLRTFHLHRVAVEEMFQINILCDLSDGHKYYIEDPDALTQDKARQWLLHTFRVNNAIQAGRRLDGRVLLEEIPNGAEYLPLIMEGMLHNKALRLTYQPFYEPQPAVYHVQPYSLKVHRQRWYMLGMCRELGGVRHFALDRTVGMELTEEPFEYPADFSPEAYYRDSVGIWVNEQLLPETVVIRAYGLQSQYLRSLPLHHSQQEINTTDEYCDFQYHLCVTRDLIRELLAKGDDVEVLQPESLRQKMLESIIAMKNRY